MMRYALRMLALVSALFFAVFPVTTALLVPSPPINYKLAFIALLALGILRPRWGALALAALPALVPFLPFIYRRVPHGLIHLIVLSQALPLLVRIAFARDGLGRAAVRERPAANANATQPVVPQDSLGRAAIRERPTADAKVTTRGVPQDSVLWGWVLLVSLAIASVVTEYAAYRIVFDTPSAFWKELRDHLARYVLERPNVELSNMLVAASTYADGLLAFLVIRSTIAREQVRSLLWTIAGVGIFVALFGCLQPQHGIGLAKMWTLQDPLITRINATFSDPNALASYFALLIPLTIGLAAAGRGLVRLGWLAGAAVMGVALVMTAGRAGLIGTVAGLAVMAVITLRLRLDALDPWAFVRRYYRPVFWGVIGTAVVLLIAVTAIGTAFDFRHYDQSSYLRTWLYTFNLRQHPDLIVKGRLSIWQTVLLMIRDYPVFGIGVGRIFRLFGSYYQRLLGDPGSLEGARLSAHNTFLNVTAELGIVGLLTWLFVLIATFTTGWRAVKEAIAKQDAATCWIALGVFSGLAGYSVTMLTGDRLILREDVVMFAIASAALVTLATATMRASRVARAGIIVAVLIAASVPVRAFVARQQVRLDRVYSGLYDVESPQAGAFRWTGPRAVFYEPAGDRTLTFNMRTLAPFPQTVSISLDGAEIDRLLLSDHNWRHTTYMLPRRAASQHGYHRIELNISPTWHPPSDDRELGVMLTWPIAGQPR